MRKSAQILSVLCILMLSGLFQPVVDVDARASACPAEGCPVYLPLLRTQAKVLNLCLLTDTGGIDDGGFNQGAWQGVLDAESSIGAVGTYIESTSSDNFLTDIGIFINQGCDLIITVGWQMSAVTQTAALANPAQKFTIVDVVYETTPNNLVGQAFSSEQSAFLSGYLAAGMTLTGKVATFGGFNVPVVTQFMNGYYQGVQYYNTQHTASVEVLGWDLATQTGTFSNDFVNPALGSTLTQAFFAQGADIIFPVAGETGLGAAQAAQAQASTWVIGVDTDWKIQHPEYSAVVLTSVLKNIRVSTLSVIHSVYNNAFVGGTYQGTLANQGVGIGTMSTSVPQSLLTEIEQIKSAIISGTIVVTP